MPNHEQMDSAHERLSIMEYAGTAVDKLQDLKNNYDSLSPEERKRLLRALEEIVKALP